MSEDNPACTRLAEQIAGLSRSVDRLRWILDNEPDLSGGTRQRVGRQIWESEAAINELNHELELCRSDLTVVGVEMTQAIQFFDINGQGSRAAPDNSVPLVAQRATVLRVYTDCKRAAHQWPGDVLPMGVLISGQVTVDRIGVDGSVRRLGSLLPINGSISARTSLSIDRGQANHTLNFRVPATYCQGMLRFTVTVFEDAPEILGSLARAERRASFTTQVHGRFAAVPAFRVHGVLVHYTGDGMNLPAPTGLDLVATLDYTLRTYPIGRIEFEECTNLDFGLNLRTPGGGCGPGFEGPGGLMEILQDFDEKSDRTAIHVGLIPRGAQLSVGGCGNRNVAAARDGAGVTMAQEVGHALDRKHAPYAPGYDEDFPQYGNHPWGSIGEFGFDVYSSETYDPSYVHDFMSYDYPKWISPYTYMGIRGTMFSRFGEDDMRRMSFEIPAQDSRQETLFLSFRIQRSGTVEISPSFHVAAKSRPVDPSPASRITCELLDAADNVLVSHVCRLRGPHASPEGPYVDFREPIPWTDDAVAIRFLRGDDLLHTHSIEKSKPDVSLVDAVVRATAKPLSFAWKAKGSKLSHMVRFSSDDGRHWRLVAVGLGQSQCQLDLSRLPGGRRCRIQVIVSSGVRTAIAESRTFAAPIKPRTAAIVPAESREPGAVIHGGAFSPDFGLPDPQDTTWTSHIDGFLGNGYILPADGLKTEGVHEITVSAPDGAGGIAAASTTYRYPQIDKTQDAKGQLATR